MSVKYLIVGMKAKFLLLLVDASLQTSGTNVGLTNPLYKNQ